MQINIKGKNLDLTPAIKNYAQEKMDMLEKYLGNVSVINCDFEVEMSTHHRKGNIFRAEVNLSVPQELLRVEKEEDDLYKAIDKVKDHMIRSIEKYKQKRIDRNRQEREDKK